MDKYIEDIYKILEENNINNCKEIAKQYESQIRNSLNDGFSMEEIKELLGTPEQILEIQLKKVSKIKPSSTKNKVSIALLTIVISILLLIGFGFFVLVLASSINIIIASISNNNTTTVFTIILTTLATLFSIGIIALLLKSLIKTLMIK